MRIVILSQYYSPEPVPIPQELASALVERGHDVRVLTGFPSYPRGRIYPGFQQRWRSHERDGGAYVLRVPLHIDHSQNPLARMVSYASFAFSSASARHFVRDADVVYVYATQMTAALGPWIWAAAGGAPYVLHVQDLWPDSILGSSMVNGNGRARAIEALLTPWLRSVYRRAAAVVGIAPTMVRELVARGVQPDRAHLVYNWAARDAHPVAAAPWSPGIVRIVYAGNVGDLQDLETAVHAARAAADAGVLLTVVGDGVALKRIEALASGIGATNVDFIAPVARERMPEVYAAADFALVPLKDLPVFRGTIPSKFQAVLAHAIPPITTVQGDVRELTERLDLGLAADAESIGSLESVFREAAALTEVERRAMAHRARRAYEEMFSFDAGVSRLENILLAATRGRGKGTQ